jgi:gas vesicle protein
MRNSGDGDASFLIGLVLGVVVGAAVVFILTSATAESDGRMLSERTTQALESKANEAEERVEGAAEGATS